MKKLIGLLLAVVLLTGLALTAVAESQGTVMYISTPNGKGLNVRSAMDTSQDNVIATLPYGSKVLSYGNPQPGWTYVEIGNVSGYAMSRYLTKQKPAAHDDSSKSSESGTKSKTFDTKAANTVEQMNSLLAAAKSVEPYNVTVRPVRASGWVYLRWVPSRNAQQIATYPGGKEVRVIAELKDWYQVEDPDTGVVGFVNSSYVH